MSMPTGKQSKSGALARSVSAEVRAILARQRLSGKELARISGISQSYIAKRLRDEAPFTLNDIEKICLALNEDFTSVMLNAAKSVGKH
jgi:transcriptional regulator with XRE-family HTH domain